MIDLLTVCIFLIALAAGISGKFRGLAFPIALAGTVMWALSHPGHFKEWNGIEFKLLIVPLIQLIMFGMGATLSVADFKRVASMPKPVVAGLLCQFTVMPLSGFLLSRLFGFGPEIAAGIVLVGCSPGGVASNVMTFLAKGNVALSVTLTAAGTLIAPVLTPLLMQLLAGEMVSINTGAMMLDITKIILLPIIAGLIINRYAGKSVKAAEKFLPGISMFAIAYIIAIITASGSTHLMQIGPLLVLACLLHNLIGYSMGYFTGRLLKFTEADCRTISIEVGLQNAGLASALALTMNKLATAGLASAVFGPLMNISGSLLAMRWGRSEKIKAADRSSEEKR